MIWDDIDYSREEWLAASLDFRIRVGFSRFVAAGYTYPPKGHTQTAPFRSPGLPLGYKFSPTGVIACSPMTAAVLIAATAGGVDYHRLNLSGDSYDRDGVQADEPIRELERTGWGVRVNDYSSAGCYLVQTWQAEVEDFAVPRAYGHAVFVLGAPGRWTVLQSTNRKQVGPHLDVRRDPVRATTTYIARLREEAA